MGRLISSGTARPHQRESSKMRNEARCQHARSLLPSPHVHGLAPLHCCRHHMRCARIQTPQTHCYCGRIRPCSRPTIRSAYFQCWLVDFASSPASSHSPLAPPARPTLRAASQATQHLFDHAAASIGPHCSASLPRQPHQTCPPRDASSPFVPCYGPCSSPARPHPPPIAALENTGHRRLRRRTQEGGASF